MLNMQSLFILVCLVIIIIIFFVAVKKKQPLAQPSFETEKQILQEHVLFYQQLPSAEKIRFEQSLQKFLQKVRITAVQTVADDTDRVFIAAAAIIPIFAFKDWEYTNIHEVLLYPDSFDKDYRLAGNGRDTLGMVGNGPLQNEMILSKTDLRNGFLNTTDKSNTAIHEFVHLVDKTDGDADGLPEALLPHRYALPWLKRIHEEIKKIQAGKSDINPYGTVNEAEFFAVAAEYFFKQPHFMSQKHPELYAMLQQIFTPAAANVSP